MVEECNRVLVKMEEYCVKKNRLLIFRHLILGLPYALRRSYSEPSDQQIMFTYFREVQGEPPYRIFGPVESRMVEKEAEN